ncbi:MAG TPA: hypothetical protein VGX48_10595 [Pyrinomonadaceae bacterium]|jgi:hypothetical protein|nr:hypothetical protein [Pyrinomonadaceae bacterium]
MADDRVKFLEERLTRLEAAFSQQQPAGRTGFGGPGGVVVDPAPFPGGWGYPRPFPRPVVDPAPYPYWGGHHWPPYVVDPAPWPNPVVDPAPNPIDAIRAQAAQTAAQFGRISHIADPAPIDISRLSVSQLEATLHTINAERARLDSMETMIKQRYEQMRRQDESL